MLFWDNVVKILKRNGKTQLDMAEATGIPIQTVRGWISKGMEPRLSDAVAIAKFLNESLDFLATGEKAGESIPRDVADLAFEIQALPDVYRKIIFDSVRTLKADATAKAREGRRDFG